MTPNRKDATCAASAPEICKCGHPDYAHGDIDEGVFCGGDEFEECECKGFEHEGKDTLPLPLASPAPIGEGTPAAGPWCYDMERAPKDGTMLLLFDSMSYAAACWENEAWDFGMGGECDLEGYVAWSPIFAPKEGRP